LGNLHGLRVLDLGCGTGANAVLLAKKGAQVCGIDISERSVEVARRRALANEVSAQTEFHCGPLETARFPRQAFDVIWGDGILHHVHQEFDAVLASIRRWAKPRARIVLSEPVCFAPLLRRLRLRLPIHANATPDERPLGKEHIARLREHVPELKMRPFYLFARLRNLILRGTTYEGASALRRWSVDALQVIDYGLLSVPVLERLGGIWVLHGTLE
jgi:SAM-dependent methyltransferase